MEEKREFYLEKIQPLQEKLESLQVKKKGKLLLHLWVRSEKPTFDVEVKQSKHKQFSSYCPSFLSTTMNLIKKFQIWKCFSETRKMKKTENLNSWNCPFVLKKNKNCSKPSRFLCFPSHTVLLCLYHPQRQRDSKKKRCNFIICQAVHVMNGKLMKYLTWYSLFQCN